MLRCIIRLRLIDWFAWLISRAVLSWIDWLIRVWLDAWLIDWWTLRPIDCLIDGYVVHLIGCLIVDELLFDDNLIHWSHGNDAGKCFRCAALIPQIDGLVVRTGKCHRRIFHHDGSGLFRQLWSRRFYGRCCGWAWGLLWSAPASTTADALRNGLVKEGYVKRRRNFVLPGIRGPIDDVPLQHLVELFRYGWTSLQTEKSFHFIISSDVL